jgi:acyl-CoA dehydrogenase
MDFSYSPRTQELQARLNTFMAEHVYPVEGRWWAEIEANTAAGRRWSPLPVIEELKPRAQAAGLWNLFLPESELGAGLLNQEYAPLAEIMGAIPWSSEIFNCSAPDTGNMEVLVRYGSTEHKARWLQPLLRGEIRSGFAMTEPAVASSDATNIEARIERDGDEYVINGLKWWTSGAGDPRCKIYIFMGKTDPSAPRHSQQSMILVPADAPGVTVLRPLTVMGYDDAPHGHMEVDFKNVRVPVSNILLGEGRGFEIDQARLLTLKAAWMMDVAGNKSAKAEIAMIKVVAPQMACQVIDWAMQVFGGAGMCQDTPLAYFYTLARTLRFADGPDEVHRNAIAKLELGKLRPRA